MSEEAKKQAKSGKDKRPANPYLLYGQTVRASIKAKYPDILNKDILKKIAEGWKELSESDKKAFQDKSEALKVEYRNSHPKEKEKGPKKPKKSVEAKEPIKKKPNETMKK